MKKIDPRDRPYVRNAEELRRMYNLGGGNSGENAQTVTEAIRGESRPISSGGVYDILGDIEEILKSI